MDGVNAYNGSGGGTGASIIIGTQLTGGIGVRGVTGNGSTTTVKCYANSTQIFSWSTSTDGQTTFPWKPTATGNYTVYCSGTWSGQHVNGTVNTQNIIVPVTYTAVTGYINPKYLVLGVEYVTPGASSYTQYCNNTTVSATNSITNSIASSYQQGYSLKLSGSIIPGVLNGSVTSSYSTTFTDTAKTGNAVTVSQSTSLCTQYPGASNSYQPNNHDFDIITLWLNPVALLTYLENPSGTIVNTQWNGWGYNQKDQSAMDIVQVYVGCLNGDLSGCNLTPLKRTWDNDEHWPSGQGPALTPQDYLNILAVDPFSTCEPSTPLTQECSVTPNPARYTITLNQDVPYFQPPVGAQPITTVYNESYSVAGTQSNGYTIANSSTFGLETVFSGSAFGTAVSLTLSASQTFTTTTEVDSSLTTTNATVSTVSVTEPPCNVSGSMCNPTYPSLSGPGPTEFDVYEDNLYGTLLLYPANWQN